MGDPPSSSVGSIPSARPRSLAEVQALRHSNGDTSNEWDQLLTTTKSAAEANMDSSVLGWECHHTHFEQEEPGQPQCSRQDCGPGPPGGGHQGTGAYPGAHGWERAAAWPERREGAWSRLQLLLRKAPVTIVSPPTISSS